MPQVSLPARYQGRDRALPHGLSRLTTCALGLADSRSQPPIGSYPTAAPTVIQCSMEED